MASLSSRLLQRPPQLLARSIHTSRALASPKPSLIPPPTALSALASRLSLQPSPAVSTSLITCLTHPSYLSEQTADLNADIDPSETSESNELLATVGNSLIGLFASEHLASLYPYLPTQALQNAVTAYVGPAACVSVGRELGVAVQGGGNSGLPGTGQGANSAGVVVRWSRTALAEKNWRETRGQAMEGLKVPVGRRFQKFLKGQEQEAAAEAEGEARGKKQQRHEDVVASAVRSFIGLIYQEEGIHTARTFVHAHFLSRALDLTSLINLSNPLHVLSSVVSSHLASAGVPSSSSQTAIQPRLLASTGTNSQAPLFLVGLFLPSGLKIAEGHGSSKAMAKHRAAVNGLQSIWFTRGDQPGAEVLGIKGLGKPFGEYGEGLPSSAHEDWVYEEGKVIIGEEESEFESIEWGGKEVLPGSRR
ncbi:hypothetical protein IAR50_000751 [Cryptococcus sp. DSM 104548]